MMTVASSNQGIGAREPAGGTDAADEVVPRARRWGPTGRAARALAAVRPGASPQGGSAVLPTTANDGAASINPNVASIASFRLCWQTPLQSLPVRGQENLFFMWLNCNKGTRITVL